MKEYKFLFIKDLFNKLKQLFSHRENIKSIVELLITEESMNDSHLHPIKEKYAVVETYISVGVIREKSHILHTNYQINNQQMNLFTYLRRAITSSEEALCGRFLGLFKNFLSVIVCAAPKKNDLLGLIIRVSGILSNLDGSKLLSSNVFNQQAMCSWVSVLFLTFLTSFETLAQSSSVGLTAFTDLSIKKTISTQNPTISQDVTYTIKVRNDGIIKATGVEITDILPIGVTLKTVSVGGIGSTSNSTTAGITTIIWNVGEVSAAPTELTMIIVATVAKRGLWFNTAEITKEIEVDIDSSPNNHDINEDDQDAVCFSIEDYFYKGDEFITALPTGYTNVIWTKKVGNGVPTAVTATTPGVVLLNDGSGNIKITDITSYTEFTFSANNKNCPITGCCPIKFIYGPLGSIGDFVFSDNNKDGIQNTGDTPIPGIKVILYKADGITKVDSAITDVNGKYLFASLQTDNYKVKFIIPAGKTFSPTGAGTPSTSSVAGTDGFSPIIPIDVEGTGKAKDNLDIDAGIITNCNINVGTLTTNTPNFCLPTGGSVVLSATTTVPPIIPTGYSIKYVLTKGADLVIQQIANTPTFNLTSTGEYRIHTLVYDGNSANGSYLDLSTIVLGTTKGVDLISYIVQKSICAVLDATGVKFNVNPNPDSPVIAGATICAGSKVILGDKGPILLGIFYAWFSSATAITPFAITQSIEVSPAVTTTYYVETTLVVPGACTSKRGSVTITVNPKPENPITKSSIANDCSKNLQTVNLADAIPAISSGSTIEWHVANDVASAIITNTTTVGAGTYYAFAKSTAGCYSGGVSVTVNINPCPCIEPAIVAVPVIPSVCGNTTPIQLKAVVGGSASGGTWTSNGTGIFDNAAILTAKYTPSAADVLKGSVEFTFTTNDPDGVCIAALAKTTLVFKAKPIAPENLRCNQVICLGDSNKLFSVSQGNIVKWYATATSSLPLGIVNNAEGFVVSPSAEGTYTYYADATTPDGCVSERSSISFIVKNCLTDLVVIKKIYTPDGITTPDYLLGQTATYSIEAQNIGTTNATDVKVNDILPAGATYVSSIPTGEYNNITGVWAIGSLTKGSTKALLIQVKLNKIGMVVNTAEISGNNEDPTKKNNNKSTVTIKVVEIADLSLRKTVNKTEVNIGDEVQYTITVLNSGPNTATNVEIKDKLPVGLTYISSSTLIESAGVLTGLAASIAKGATAVFTFKAKVNTPGKITNLAEVTKSDQKDPNSTPGNASVKHEDDDDSIYINSTPVCNIEKPTIACGCTLKTICLGGEVTLTASGCVGSAEYVWSNGGSTNSITVSPKTNQTYVVYCKKDSCKSESSNAVEVKVIIVDSPLLSASPSKICAGESITLTASGCSGVVEWQTLPKQTGPQITVKPTVSETYKAVCKEYDCISSLASVDVIVTPKPNPPLIVCQKGEICPGETISMTAMNCNGQVKWSTGQETTTITVFPIVTTSYTATCSVNGCTSGNSAPFILTVKPIAIPTIKITNLVVCTGGSSTLTAGGCTGKVTWYYDSKTLTGATIIVKPTTTTTYYATCSSIVCSSDKSLPVTVQVANPGPPIVSSGTSTICLGSTVQLTATGCETGIVTWSDGQKGVVVTVKPLVSTSYTATCSIGACVSDNSIKRDITVTDFAKPTITANKSEICVGNSVTLTANGCNGTVKWSDGVTGSPRTVTPTADVKYTATCESSTCKSDLSNELTIKVNTAGPAPVVSCLKTELCVGESVTLSVTGCTGTVKWSDGSTGTTVTLKPSVTTTYSATCTTGTCESPKSNEKTITVKPTVVLNLTASASNATICVGAETTLTLAGCTGIITWTGGLTSPSIKVKPTETTTYTATCTGVACATDASASVKVTVLPGATTPNITLTNAQICVGADVTLTANNCNGALLWSNGATTASITVKPSITTIYSVKCTVDGCGEAKTSLPVTVQVANPRPPIVSSGTSTICLGSTVQLTATGCETGIVTWSDGQKGVVVTVKPLVSTSYTATCSIGACVSDNSIKRDITVTDFAKPTITANKSEICVGNSVTLTANGCNGTVKWSDGVTGSPRTVTPTADVKYTATCESSTCKSDLSNELTIKVNTAGPAPVVSCLKTELCVGESVTLSVTGCTGTVKWSDGSTGTTVTLKPSVTTTYSATCTTGTCESPKSNEKTITVKPTVVLNLTASASNATICVGAETTLTLAGCTGIITWTGGLTSPSIKVKPTETTTYTATCTGVACATDASASVKVTVLPGATTPNITLTNAQICVGADVTLTANNCNGALLWSNGATTASITVKPSITTIYSVKCTVDGCGEAKTSLPVTVQVGAPDAPIITSVPQIVCAGGSVILTATGCSSGTVLWSNSKTGVTITEVVNSTTTYSAFCKQGTCNSPESNKVTVTVTVPSVPTISCATSTICAGSTITLYATGCEGTVKWSDGQTGAIITVTPSKTTDYTATCSIGTCTSIASSVATVNVGNPPAPQITCNATSICQGIQVTLTATNCSGTIIWNDGQVGNVITAKPNATTTYTAICKLDNCESGKSNPVTVTVGAGIKTPTTKNLNNVCPFLTVDLASGVTSALSAGGIFEYHTGVLPTSPLVSSPNAVTTGTYYVFEKTGTGCYSLPGVINTYISTDCTPKDCTKMPVTISAGADTTICAEKIYKLSGTFGGAATSITWKTTGTGSFDNPLSPTATYRSSLADVLAGTVKLIICTNDPDGNGPCLAKADTMVLTMNGVKFKPLITVTGNLNSCGSDSVTLTATAGYNYMWFEVGASTTTPFARTRSVVIKSSGSYYFKLVDPNKCCSIQSDTAIVNYLTIPIAPVANSVKIDRGTTVDLNKLIVSNLPTGATLVFKTGASSGSTTIANPSAVGAGVYYTFYKNAQGCFSVSTKITVENKDGNGSSVSDADLQITIKTDKVTYAKGDTVITTITVMNFGLGTAKGITLSSIIPSTLTYVSQTGGLVKLGSLLTGTLDSLVKDGVKVYIYKSVLNTKTETVVAVGGTTTTKDPNPSNNNGTGSFGTVTVNKGDVDNSVADVAIVMTSDKTTAKVGDNVNFLLSLTNNGPATAKQVVLTNSIPVGMTFVSSSTGQVLTGGSIIISLDSLQKGQVKTYAYVAIMNVKTTVTNTVIVTSLKDNIASNNASFVIINGDTAAIAKDEAELALLLTADKQLIVKGDVVTFTIKVTNNGPKVATNIVVDNILPKYLTFQSGDPLQKGDTLRVETTSITLGSTVTYTYKAKVNKDTIIINTAKITKTSPIDPILANNVSTVVLVPASDTTYADLGVVIVANKLTYKVGENVTYTVSLTNNGAGISKNVQLCNPLPSGLTYVSGTGVIKAGDSVTIKVDTISKGNTRTFTYIIKATTVGKIANTVRICNSSKVDLITPNNTSVSSITVIKDSVLVPPICNINLTMAIIDTAKVSDGVYNVTYRLIAKNACKDTLKNVTFTNNVANIFKTPVTVEILGKPNTGVSTNLIINDLFSKTDSNLVKVGSYMLPNASDTVKYVLKITLSGNKGPFFSDAAIKGKTTSNENLRAKAKEVLRFDLQNTRIGLAKEVLIIALKNDSTTYWTVPYRIRVVNMGINAITKLSVKDSLDAVFTVKGAKIIGIPIIIATPGLTVNKKFTGSGLFTDLLVPDSSSLAKGDTAIIDLTVRVNTATSTDTEKIYNNVAIGTATGTDLLIYKDISTNGQNPDANGDKDPSNDNVATPVKLNDVSSGTKEVSIGLALASSSDTITLADSTCNVTLIMTAKNYGTGNLTKVRLCTNLGNTIGKQSESWKLIGTPVVIKGNAKISKTFNGTTDSTITRSDSTFLAVGDSIVVMYLVNIRRPVNSTIFTQAIAKAVSALDSTKSTFDISTNGLNPDVNGDGNPDEAAQTPIYCKGVPIVGVDSTLFIPKGFSPNGDGINDGFVIGGIKLGEKVELMVFNRWGSVVYANQDYKNDWKGETNTGVRVLGNGQGLPDGTYYYMVTRFKATGEKVDAAPFVRYFTILR